MVFPVVQSISARDANQHFSDILGRAARGEEIVITRRGEPVAQLMPYKASTLTRGQNGAWDRLVAMLEQGLPLGGETFDRDALYDR
jgi:prevent-host-death family protein